MRRGRTLSGTGETSSPSACTGWSPLLSSLTSSIPAASFFFPRPVAGFAASGSIKAGASAFFSARPAFAAPEAGRGSASAFAPSSGLVAGESFFSPASFSVASAPDFRAGRFGITPRNAVLPPTCFHASRMCSPDAGRTLQSRRDGGCARGSNGSLDTLIDKRAFRLTGRRARVCGVGSARRAACNQSSGGFRFSRDFPPRG